MQRVSETLRTIRKEKHLSIRNLAHLAGISPSALSQIESGHVSPSIATLEKICGGLNLPMTVLFDEPAPGGPSVLMPFATRRRIYSATSRATVEPLARGFSQKKMQPILITMEPGGEVGERPYSGSEGEEFAIVISGEVQFEQNGQVFQMKALDAVYFDPKTPHNWRNPGAESSTLLLVASA